MEDVDFLATQRGMPPPQPDQVLCKAQVILHFLLRSRSPQTVPVDKRVGEEPGLSLQGLSSRNSCPMNSIGTPVPVRSSPVATRERLRPYHERESFRSPPTAMLATRHGAYSLWP